MTEILVLYYSRKGSTAELARQVCRGIESVAGVTSKLRTVPAVSAENEGEKPPVVVAQQGDRLLKFDAGLTTQIEGLALAMLGSTSVDAGAKDRRAGFRYEIDAIGAVGKIIGELRKSTLDLRIVHALADDPRPVDLAAGQWRGIGAAGIKWLDCDAVIRSRYQRFLEIGA